MYLEEKRLGEAHIETWQQRTIALLRRRGWKQRGYGMPEGPYCLAGAIKQAHWEMPEVANAIIRNLNSKLGMEVWQWNDAPGRTMSDVLELLGD